MQEGMSALLLKADMCSALAYVCFGPKADMRRAQQLSLISGRMMVARRRNVDVRFGSNADISQCNRHVCLTPKADMCSALAHVCFGP